MRAYHVIHSPLSRLLVGSKLRYQGQGAEYFLDCSPLGGEAPAQNPGRAESSRVVNSGSTQGIDRGKQPSARYDSILDYSAL